jgi:hypothetical protein
MLQGRDWSAAPAAEAEVLERLRQISPVELPASYLSLLAFSDGGEEEGPYVELSIWLRPGADGEKAAPIKTELPEREADLNLGAEGLFPAGDFWSRCPGVEHAMFIEDFMHCWWSVKLWFTDPASIVKPPA